MTCPGARFPYIGRQTVRGAASPSSSLHIAAAIIGNAFEFYDFTVYAASIGRAFFPTGNPHTGLLLSVAQT